MEVWGLRQADPLTLLAVVSFFERVRKDLTFNFYLLYTAR